MSYERRKRVCYVVIAALLLCFGIFLRKGAGKVAYAAKLPEAKKTAEILVISIDPKITNPITGKEQYASEYLGFSLDKSVKNLKDNLEKGSNGSVEFKVVETIYTEEFPKYVGYDSMTEEQFFKLFPVKAGKGEWYGWWTRNSQGKVISPDLDGGMHFDYSYLVETYHLEEKRNNGEFDMVWAFGIDPLSMYETAMVGRDPFWVNGAGVKADCDNFVIGGFTFSRSDGALEAFCHLAESMLNYTYGIPDAQYNAKVSFEDFSELSTWEKFYLCQNKSDAGNKTYGVGQVHFPPNATGDYDWENKTSVESYHQQFLDSYPEISNEVTTSFSSSVYDKSKGYQSDAAGDRYHVWWLQHMPHYKGRDENGYSHNWWDYILDTKYVRWLTASEKYDDNTIIIPKGGEVSDISFEIQYKGTEAVATSVKKSGAALKFEENKVFTVENGTVKALSHGTANLKIIYDGHELEYMIEVPAPTYHVTVEGGNIKGKYSAGNTVTIVADDPEYGTRFKEWQVKSGTVAFGSATASQTTFLMPEHDVVIKAVYEELPEYTVEVLGGSGSTEKYAGERVSISANEPEPGMRFKNWAINSGNVKLNESDAKKTFFVMPEEAVQVEAVYEEIPKYELTVIEGTGSGEIYAGAEVTIQANVPARGMRFQSWKVTGTKVSIKKEANEVSFYMPEGPVTVEAIYVELPKYKTTVINGTGSGEYYAGDMVVVEANAPEEGMRFKEWKIVKGALVNLVGTNEIMAFFIMDEGEVQLEAIYEEIPKYVLTVAGGDGTGEYHVGTELTIEAAEPEEGMRFKGWQSNDIEFVSQSVEKRTVTFRMPEHNGAIDAIYEAIPSYTLEVISGSGSGEVRVGDSVTVKANDAPEGMLFKEWKVISGSVELSSETEETFVMPEGNVVIEAVYEVIPVTEEEVVTGETDTLDKVDLSEEENPSKEASANNPMDYRNLYLIGGGGLLVILICVFCIIRFRKK